MSYTNFEYSNASVQADGDAYVVSVEVKNVGKVAGKESVQLYVAAPDAAKSNKPEKELKAFAKTALLQPGESSTLTMRVAAADLASFCCKENAWKVAAGNYQFLVAANSRDIRATLSAEVAASSAAVHPLFAKPEQLNILKR